MNVSPFQPHVKASDLPIDKLASNPNVSDSDKVGQACRQFEAIFLREIFKEMRKTVISSSIHKDTAVSSIYDDMVNNQLADGISRSGAFGLAKSLQGQLTQQVLHTAPGAVSGDAHALKERAEEPVTEPFVSGVHANAANSKAPQHSQNND